MRSYPLPWGEDAFADQVSDIVGRLRHEVSHHVVRGLTGLTSELEAPLEFPLLREDDVAALGLPITHDEEAIFLHLQLLLLVPK